MDIASWPDSDLARVAQEIARLDLQQHVYELEMFGLTVVPASKTGASALVETALERILDIHHRRTGVRPDVATGDTHAGVFLPTLHAFLNEDEVFVQLMMHPLAQALLSVLLGNSCVYAGVQTFIKGPGDAQAHRPSEKALRRTMSTDGLQLALHADMIMQPEPFPHAAQAANVTWLLTDYTKENGAMAFVPGSHRYCRHPRNNEAVELTVPVEAPRGSLVVFGANTWHGSYPRTTPGLRVGLAYVFMRSYLAPFETTIGEVPAAWREKYGPRLTALLSDGLHWGTEGPDPREMARRPLRATLYS